MRVALEIQLPDHQAADFLNSETARLTTLRYLVLLNRLVARNLGDYKSVLRQTALSLLSTQEFTRYEKNSLQVIVRI